MEDQELKAQVEKLALELQQAQSRSFELISQISAERDNLRKGNDSLQSIITEIVSILGLTNTNPTVNQVYSVISSMVTPQTKSKSTKKAK